LPEILEVFQLVCYPVRRRQKSIIGRYNYRTVIKSELQGPWSEERREKRVCRREEAAVNVDDDWVQARFEVFWNQDGSFDLVIGDGLVPWLGERANG
jgi:hypothetical protein